MKIKVIGQHFLLRYMDSRFDEIENIIRPMPNLTFREYPYNITDKKSDVKYAVTRIDGGIELRYVDCHLASRRTSWH